MSTRKHRNDILTAAVLGVLLAFALACDSKKGGGSSAGSPSPGAAAPAKEGSTTPAAAAPALKLEVKALLKDYKENEVAADTKYKDKIVEITGTVDQIKKDVFDHIYVTVGTGAPFEIPTAQCFFDDSATAQAAALKKGQKITIRGRVDGLMMNVLIKDSVFVK